MSRFDEETFRCKVNKALQIVRQILDSNRNPVYSSDVQHSYLDKYVIMETMVRLATVSCVNTFSVIGLTADQLRNLVSWSAKGRFRFDWKWMKSVNWIAK